MNGEEWVQSIEPATAGLESVIFRIRDLLTYKKLDTGAQGAICVVISGVPFW